MLIVLAFATLLTFQADPDALNTDGANPNGGGIPELLVERRLAEVLQAGVGDTVAVSPLSGERTHPFVIAGVFERAADPSRISRNEYEVRFHIPDLERLTGTTDRVDRFAVALRDGAEVTVLGEWVESLAFGTSVYETARVAEEASATFTVVSRFHAAIAVVTLLASGIFLLCLMVVRVDGRRGDVGTMRLMGISRRTVMAAVVGEAVAIAVIASIIGAGLGWVVARLVNVYYAGYYDTTLRFAFVTPGILAFAVVLGVVLGVIAGGLAAARVATVPVQRLGER